LDFSFYSGIIGKQVKNPNTKLVLCNKYNYLPSDYVPEGYKKTDGRVLSLQKEAQEQFDKMRADALKSGINIYIVSGYRSYAVQNQIFNNYKLNDPKGAETYSARPGYSEHQTGLAADLNSASASANFQNTKEYAWLTANAHKYGFILRYPKGKEWITGYIFEPWHWRYVGVKVAEKIKELDITFDEYYAIYLVPQNYNMQ
jgi:LAS superfamily LD-carboxypeptidase LdcB